MHQQCTLPGCLEAVEQPKAGGPPRLYCTHAHRAAARELRRIARSDAEPVAACVETAQTIPVPPQPLHARLRPAGMANLNAIAAVAWEQAAVSARRPWLLSHGTSPAATTARRARETGR
jgi:hypothetical protein